MRYIFITILAIIYFVSSSAPGYGNRRKWMFYDHSRESIVCTAIKYLGVRYRYGGTSPFGFDCSGFVMFVFRKNGIILPRNAKGQFQNGTRISIQGAKPGDLVFFRIWSRRRSRSISHVGIYLGDHQFIHSPSRGKRISITSIRNPYWRKRYIGTVSVLKSSENLRRYTKRLD
jgi:cell wall-associated NlpC family hydrolase